MASHAKKADPTGMIPPRDPNAPPPKVRSGSHVVKVKPPRPKAEPSELGLTRTKKPKTTKPDTIEDYRDAMSHNSKSNGALALQRNIETPVRSDRGMYASEVNPEIHIEIFKRNLGRPLKGVPWKYSTVEALQSEVMSYFEFMISNRIPVTIAGLCAWLGISIMTMKYWREHQDILPLYPTMETATSFIHAMTEQGVVDGNIPALPFTFLAKNYFRMTDTMTVEQANGAQVGMSREEQQTIVRNMPKADIEDARIVE